MIEGGHAPAVMGNHELNALAYHTEDLESPGEYRGRYVWQGIIGRPFRFRLEPSGAISRDAHSSPWVLERPMAMSNSYTAGISMAAVVKP